MKSMTGYGKGACERAGRCVTVELKSVNHRFLDLNIKLPKSFSQFEDVIRKCVQRRISRGHIDVYLNFEDAAAEANVFVANVELARNYLAAAAKLSAEVGIEDDLTLSSLVKVPDIIERCEAEVPDEELAALITQAVESAICELEEMRAVEGKAIAADISAKLKLIEGFVERIAERAPHVVTDYRDRLKQRVTELTSEAAVDDARIASEVAIFSDRCSIDEELTRLKAHIAQLFKFLASDGDCGRKIDFLLQEMNRETNTIGSKANDLIITQNVLKLKNEIEKIREQAQNIE